MILQLHKADDNYDKNCNCDYIPDIVKKNDCKVNFLLRLLYMKTIRTQIFCNLDVTISNEI